ncbi:hypothetical protein Alsa1_CDS0193 [Staphylococcus phage Alsa_1]|nr:hypothetical protein Alsa1_CDS0193 [Staphylococcus phage Alsa_1]
MISRNVDLTDNGIFMAMENNSTGVIDHSGSLVDKLKRKMYEEGLFHDLENKYSSNTTLFNDLIKIEERDDFLTMYRLGLICERCGREMTCLDSYFGLCETCCIDLEESVRNRHSIDIMGFEEMENEEGKLVEGYKRYR